MLSTFRDHFLQSNFIYKDAVQKAPADRLSFSGSQCLILCGYVLCGTWMLEGQQSQQDIKKGQLGDQIGTCVEAVAERRTRDKNRIATTLNNAFTEVSQTSSTQQQRST